MLSLDEIKKVCEDAQVLELCLPVLDNPKFLSCPLNLEVSLPYSYVGGLASYTYETLSSGILMCSLYKNYNNADVNIKEYIVSAIWHSCGKMWQYKCSDDDITVWSYALSPPLIIETAYRSAQQFEAHISGTDVSDSGISTEKVVHNILSTLTQQPHTAEAHLLLSNIKLSHSLYSYKPSI